jgi:hypothetical protein
MPAQLSIYIELQNVLKQEHIKELQVLSILSRGEGIVQHLNHPQAADIRIDPLNRKWMFVLKYLHLLQTKKIDEIELTFSQFNQDCDNNVAGTLLPHATISELIEIYLFKPLR